jgi:ATP dependent DNA ligase domain
MQSPGVVQLWSVGGVLRLSDATVTDTQVRACGSQCRRPTSSILFAPDRAKRTLDELFAFDLMELNGNDLRRIPIEQRKAALAELLSHAAPRIQVSERIQGDGALVFEHACKLGFEGIVSKRKGSPCNSGRSPHARCTRPIQAPGAPAFLTDR